MLIRLKLVALSAKVHNTNGRSLDSTLMQRSANAVGIISLSREGASYCTVERSILLDPVLASSYGFPVKKTTVPDDKQFLFILEQCTLVLESRITLIPPLHSPLHQIRLCQTVSTLQPSKTQHHLSTNT